jgi:hypothetical protein
MMTMQELKNYKKMDLIIFISIISIPFTLALIAIIYAISFLAA